MATQKTLFDTEDSQPARKKSVATLHIDQDDKNADWTKRNRASELAIHAELAEKHEREKRAKAAKKAAMGQNLLVYEAEGFKAKIFNGDFEQISFYVDEEKIIITSLKQLKEMVNVFKKWEKSFGEE